MTDTAKRFDGEDPRERNLEKALRFQKKLHHITNKINSAGDTNEILTHLQDEILSLFEAERITIYVVDGLKKQIVSRFKTGEEVNEIRVPIDNKSISGFCAATGRMLKVADVYNEVELRRLNPELRFNRSFDEKTGYRTAQVMAAPIIHNRYLLGVIQLINKKNGRPFTSEDKESVREIAKVLGIAFFNNQKAYQKSKNTKFDFLVRENVISSDELLQAMTEARKHKKSVETLLMENHKVTREDIGRSLAFFFKTRFVVFNEKTVIPGELLKNLRPEFLRKNLFVPVSSADGKVTVVMENPDHLPSRDTIKRLIPGKEIEYCVALKEDIFRMIDHFFDVNHSDLFGDSRSIGDLLGKMEAEADENEFEVERVSEEDGAIVQLVNKMIIDAYNRNASDIHIEPRQGRDNAIIRYRIDGVCQPYETIPYTFKKAIVSRLKIMSDLDISERRLPQDGKIKLKKYIPLDIELRVVSLPTAGGNEDVVIRLLSNGEPILLDKMGMSERNRKAFVEMITKPYGMVLVVGPTGSGKTTTLHAALHHINKPDIKIWTAEDPVEITQDGLRQVQVKPKIGFDFARAMRAFLRADPDVIMVGEMRDRETAAVGIEASLTGHLVFSTLHTNTAPDTIVRLLDMGMDTFNFADALLGVLAQRLVRTLCTKCRRAYHSDRLEVENMIRIYGEGAEDLGCSFGEGMILYAPRGCPDCANTGYQGRVGLHELLDGSDEMKSLIQSGAKVGELRSQARRDGMTTLMQDGIRKIFLGETDLRQVRRVCVR